MDEFILHYWECRVCGPIWTGAGLRDCKNGPVPFPSRMSYKVTKQVFCCFMFVLLLRHETTGRYGSFDHCGEDYFCLRWLGLTVKKWKCAITSFFSQLNQFFSAGKDFRVFWYCDWYVLYREFSWCVFTVS